MGLVKRSELERLRKELRERTRINTAPGMLVDRTTRGNFARPVKKAGSGGGGGFVPRWG